MNIHIRCNMYTWIITFSIYRNIREARVIKEKYLKSIFIWHLDMVPIRALMELWLIAYYIDAIFLKTRTKYNMLCMQIMLKFSTHGKYLSKSFTGINKSFRHIWKSSSGTIKMYVKLVTSSKMHKTWASFVTESFDTWYTKRCL